MVNALNVSAVRKVSEPAPFRFLLRFDDGEPNDPVVFVTLLASWKVGETFLMGDRSQLRILAIDTEIDEELVECGFSGVFTVEPA